MNGDREEAPSVGRLAINRRDSTNIAVSVECPLEPRIAEITYDGREIIQPPISKGEKLYRNACKINFGKEKDAPGIEDDLISVGVEESREKDNGRVRRGRANNDASSLITALEGVRTKLRSAYTEMTVLHDVISLTRDRKYLRLEPTANEPLECKPHFSLHCKKKAVAGAAQILSVALERLKQLSSNATAAQRMDNDYHSTLAKLRDDWRLKKVGPHVSGDLSYRTVGSSIKGAGQFEIRKNEESDEKPIDVLIAGDLGGETCIQIDIESSAFPDSAKNYADVLKTKDVWSGILTVDNPLHRQLSAAQNSLYCRELIMLLSAEAVNLPNQCLSPVVFADEVHYTSFLGHSVRVKLIQVPEKAVAHAESGASNLAAPETFKPNSTLTESRAIEWAMSLTMLSRMRDFSNPDLPIAACGPMGLKSFRRKMAIQARDRRVWKQPGAGRTLTAQLLDMAQALLLKKRLSKIADEVASADLIVIVHDSSSLTSWKDILIKISITTPGYDMYNRSTMAFRIQHGEAYFITRDYVVPISVSDDLDCHLLYIEIVRQHAVVLQHTLKTHRFDITQYVPTYGFFDNRTHRPPSSSLTKAMAYGITVIARSSDERWIVRIVCSLRYVYRFYVASSKSGKRKTSAIRNESFLPTDYHFHEVDLSRIVAGDTRIKRISLVLCYLASLPGSSTFLVHTEGVQLNLRRETVAPSTAWQKWEDPQSS